MFVGMFLCLFGIALQYIALLTHSTLFLEFFANIQILHLPQWQTFRGSHGRDGLLAPRFGGLFDRLQFQLRWGVDECGDSTQKRRTGKECTHVQDQSQVSLGWETERQHGGIDEAHSGATSFQARKL